MRILGTTMVQLYEDGSYTIGKGEQGNHEDSSIADHVLLRIRNEKEIAREEGKASIVNNIVKSIEKYAKI